ncbi:hypothetical protein BB050_01447 [Flavobacterium anhuiense]|uniref:Uncharacterized protein n=1 Tax=Flavobacterium anhuiense TaxID=459526 RepID=A0AAC9GHK2_9FLAO|nr:hypothetical protein [Flavobacterium anhuiense]AOC94575.1 hypothetical protein BB050_01447 [Flavobacterium anhuiense]
MIVSIEKTNSRLGLIQNIPKKFFSLLEESQDFGDHLFPNWAIDVFAPTDLKNKFEEIFNIYKAINNSNSRSRIIEAFTNTNKIEDLCNNNLGVPMIIITDLPLTIRGSLDRLFSYLYNTAINYHGFQTYVDDTLRKTIDRFIIKNKVVVCPFCGLESFINIEGQARLSLDHWLCKDFFPMASVNLNNLVPIGQGCNQRPAKGNKNILVNEINNSRLNKSYYPYSLHGGFKVIFNFINEPNGNDLKDDDWSLIIGAIDPLEDDIFQNWNSIMNIEIRYNDYFKKDVFPLWESDYKEHILDPDNDLNHAQNITELKSNFKNWKSTFKIKGRPGALIYRAFIDYLIERASDAYLHGLLRNLRV